MTLSIGMIWEVRPGGDDTNNSGGFRGGAQLVTPTAAPVISAVSGGTNSLSASTTYYVVLTYIDAYGETTISPQSSAATTTTNKNILVNALTSPPTKFMVYNIYISTVSGGPYYYAGNSLPYNSFTVGSMPATTQQQPPGTDYSQQTNIQFNGTNLTVDGTTNTRVIPDGHTVAVSDVGNTVRIMTTGTGAAFTVGVYEIIGITAAAGQWILDRSPAAVSSAGASWNVGGCFASPGQAFAFVSSGQNVVHVASATYLMSATLNVSGGSIDKNVGGWGIIGYGSARWDGGTKPIFRANANSMTILNLRGGSCYADNLELDGNSKSPVTCLTSGNTSNNHWAYNLNIHHGISITWQSSTNWMIDCEIHHMQTCQITGSSITHYHSCSFHDNVIAAGNSLISMQMGSIINCIFANNTCSVGNPVNMVKRVADGSIIANCSFYQTVNRDTAVNLAAGGIMVNCYIEGFAVAIDATGAGYQGVKYFKNATYNNTQVYSQGGTNTTAVSQIPLTVSGFSFLTGSAFVNAAGGDFSINNTTNAGASLRAAGKPSSFPGLSTNSYPDIGAAQHQDTAAVINSSIIIL